MTKTVSRACKLSSGAINRFNSILKRVTKFIPKEFQRKKFDLKEFSNWKASQFCFFLLYCGVFVFCKILNNNMFRHFLLLVTACRILCSPELCLTHVNFADDLLRKFFELLPSFYGFGSQIMNNYNLIHLTDDVLNANCDPSVISAFFFENHLGKLKQIITGKNKYLAQLVRRISEQRQCPLSLEKQISKTGTSITDEERPIS